MEVKSHSLISQRHVELEKRVEQMQKELDSATDQVPNEPVVIPFLRREVITEVQDKMFGKAEITKKQTRNYVLSQEQYQEFTKQVNAAVTIKNDYERLRKTNFVQENEGLRLGGEYLIQDNKELKIENKKLEREVRMLNTEISSLKAHIKDLEMNIRVLYQQTKKSLKRNFRRLENMLKMN